MKLFAAVAVFGLVALATANPFTDEQKKLGQMHAKECMAETGVDPATVQKLKQGDFSNNDEKAQCFTLCFFRKAGFMDAQGNKNKDVIIEKLSGNKDKAQVTAVYDNCESAGGSSPCNKAWNAYQCYRKAVQF